MVPGWHRLKKTRNSFGRAEIPGWAAGGKNQEHSLGVGATRLGPRREARDFLEKVRYRAWPQQKKQGFSDITDWSCDVLNESLLHKRSKQVAQSDCTLVSLHHREPNSMSTAMLVRHCHWCQISDHKNMHFDYELVRCRIG